MRLTNTDPTVGPSTSLRDEVKLVVRSFERTPIGLSVTSVKIIVKKVAHVERLKMI